MSVSGKDHNIIFSKLIEFINRGIFINFNSLNINTFKLFNDFFVVHK